jgi:hypothetical protein
VANVNVDCSRTQSPVPLLFRTTTVTSFTGMGFPDPQEPALYVPLKQLQAMNVSTR